MTFGGSSGQDGYQKLMDGNVELMTSGELKPSNSAREIAPKNPKKQINDAELKKRLAEASGLSFDIGYAGGPSTADTVSVSEAVSRAQTGDQMVKKTKTCCERYRAGDFTVVPERGKEESMGHWIEFWDAFVFLMLIITAYFVPFDVALLDGKDSLGCLIVTHLLDVTFTVDMVLQFFVAVENHHDSLTTALWEKDPTKIARFYCAWPFSQGGAAGWFWLDLLSVAPGWVLTIMTALHDSQGENILMIMRVFRLLRMLRLLRLKRLFMRWNAELGLSYLYEELSKFFVITTFAVHWLACLWVMIEGRVLQHFVALPQGKSSWLSAVIEAKGDTCNPRAEDNPVCVYFMSLYWSTMTLTSVGYGDIIPQNEIEYVVCIGCMLLSGYIWAYIVGCILSLLMNLDPYGVQFRHQMDDLNELMANRGLKHSLRVRLRRYMNEAADIPRVQGQRMLLESTISVGLQREVAAATASGSMLDGVFWFRDLEPQAKHELVRLIKNMFFGPQEAIIVRDSMIMIRKGFVAAKGRILRPGDAWGHESILLVSTELREGSYPTTITYVSALALSRSDLHDTCKLFPSMDKRLRRAQVRVAVLRACSKLSKERKTGVSDGNPENMRPLDSIIQAAKPAPGTFAGGSQDTVMRGSKESTPVAASGPYRMEHQLQKGLKLIENNLAKKQDLAQRLLSEHQHELSSQIQDVSDKFDGKLATVSEQLEGLTKQVALLVAQANKS
eukprot:gnl/TRDRNA2_/TRDRNA2_163216_c2_seq1.p1 gnl/TRDRNA2_/TRDRNA2_163216_c2~~gnl/TRDRNA2_/TRDRNA2_163216_c2_seq1.p1  ORF type:complete len:728 (+),score=102.97 gnl/TRDRNA2_/TRDRNA2_163216_c2_seq1:48-2231(+)